MSLAWDRKRTAARSQHRDWWSLMWLPILILGGCAGWLLAYLAWCEVADRIARIR